MQDKTFEYNTFPDNFIWEQLPSEKNWTSSPNSPFNSDLSADGNSVTFRSAPPPPIFVGGENDPSVPLHDSLMAIILFSGFYLACLHWRSKRKIQKKK